LEDERLNVALPLEGFKEGFRKQFSIRIEISADS